MIEANVLLTAIPIGIAFGIALERAGLGDSRVIAGQLNGCDFTVVRVMFGAIVTAMLGLAVFERAGVLDIGNIAIPPTDIAGQAIGAVIFGGGFALAALCPGTACVAASGGRRDGLAAIVGLLVGTALTAVLWPLLDGVVGVDVRDGAQIDRDLGIERGTAILGITVMAVCTMMIARRFHTGLSRSGVVAWRASDGARDRKWWKLSTPEVAALSVAFVLALPSKGIPAPASLALIAAEIENETDHVDPIELAVWIRQGRKGLRVIDVRDTVDSLAYVIPGAEVVPLSKLASLRVEPGEVVVLYSEGGTHAAQGWVLLRARGVTNAFVLRDGIAAWEDEVLNPLVPAGTADSATRAMFARARELSMYFGGHPRLELDATRLAPTPSVGEATAKRARRRNTC